MPAVSDSETNVVAAAFVMAVFRDRQPRSSSGDDHVALWNCFAGCLQGRQKAEVTVDERLHGIYQEDGQVYTCDGRPCNIRANILPPRTSGASHCPKTQPFASRLAICVSFVLRIVFTYVSFTRHSPCIRQVAWVLPECQQARYHNIVFASGACVMY